MDLIDLIPDLDEVATAEKVKNFLIRILKGYCGWLINSAVSSALSAWTVCRKHRVLEMAKKIWSSNMLVASRQKLSLF